MTSALIPVIRSRVCPPCAVTWRSDTKDDACWVCGAPGLYTAEVVLTNDGRIMSPAAAVAALLEKETSR